MVRESETEALVALLRGAGRSWRRRAAQVSETGGARAELEAQHGLLAGEQLACARAEIAAWKGRGIEVVSLGDGAYPENLRTVADRPPLLFIAGRLASADPKSIAVIGSREATQRGLGVARAIAKRLVQEGFVVVSGLASGIDTAAHAAALGCGGRTIAVIGTGLDRCYPAQNAALQRKIAQRCAVVSQFWPESAPSRSSFPMRNAVMSGFALGTVIVEASHTSGARIQARLALAQGRPLILLEPLLEQQWARELAARAGVHVISCAAEIAPALQRALAVPTELLAASGSSAKSA
jgi:DNA processing protein